jgi:hypothetical protein
LFLFTIAFYTQQAEQQLSLQLVQIVKAIEVFPVGITLIVSESVQSPQAAGRVLGQVLLLAAYLK